MYGLKEKHIAAIHSVFKKHPEIQQAILYGSRAKGNYRNGSDIDLTLKGKQITLSQLFEIETELDDLLLPYKIDLSIYHKIENPDFIEHINRVGIVFFKKEVSEWKKVKLGDYFKVKHGYAFKGKHITKEVTPNILVTPGNFHIGGGFKNSNNKYFEDINYPSDYILETGDIVVTMTDLSKETDTLGYSAKIPKSKNGEKYLHNQRVGLVQFINDEADKDFLYWIMRTREYQWYIIGSASGTSIMHTSPTRIQDYEFQIPSDKEEQKAIANILTSLDDKIDLLHTQNDTLEAMSETLFRQWFVEEADLNWEEKPLSGIANFLNGLACQKFTPKNEIDKLPVLKIKQLRNGFSNDSDWCTTDVKPEYIVKNGDVIFSWSASLMIKIWDGETAILNQHLFKVTSDEFPKWFYYLWSKFHLKEFISISESHATTMGHIKRSDLDNAMVLVPDDNKMIEFTEIQKPIIDKIIYNSQQLSTLTEIRDTLLPNLMSGQIRVKP